MQELSPSHLLSTRVDPTPHQKETSLQMALRLFSCLIFSLWHHANVLKYVPFQEKEQDSRNFTFPITTVSLVLFTTKLFCKGACPALSASLPSLSPLSSQAPPHHSDGPVLVGVTADLHSQWSDPRRRLFLFLSQWAQQIPPPSDTLSSLGFPVPSVWAVSHYSPSLSLAGFSSSSRLSRYNLLLLLCLHP